MRKLISIAVAFLLWAAIFFGQAACGVSYAVIMLTTFFLGFPLSAWVARRATGIDPYKLLYP